MEPSGKQQLGMNCNLGFLIYFVPTSKRERHQIPPGFSIFQEKLRFFDSVLYDDMSLENVEYPKVRGDEEID